jgi:fructose-bisphosphate aldolase class 1
MENVKKAINAATHSEVNDNVEHPKHYTAGKIECIDCIESIIAPIKEPEQAFLAGQIIKYVARYTLKNGVEDLKKARWYLDRLIGKVEEKK